MVVFSCKQNLTYGCVTPKQISRFLALSDGAVNLVCAIGKLRRGFRAIEDHTDCERFLSKRVSHVLLSLRGRSRCTPFGFCGYRLYRDIAHARAILLPERYTAQSKYKVRIEFQNRLCWQFGAGGMDRACSVVGGWEKG
jgi:hypothetical protein